MPWPVMIIDRDLVICFYNSLAVQLLEATKPMSGTKLDQLIHDQAILQLVQESIQTGRSCQGEHNKDNSSIAWKISVTPLEHDSFLADKSAEGAKDLNALHSVPLRPLHGTIAGDDGLSSPYDYLYFAIAIEDLSELRRLERVRRDFIANISHELRTP